MNIFLKLVLIISFFTFLSCGKKSTLERYPGSDYPKNYPANNE